MFLHRGQVTPMQAEHPTAAQCFMGLSKLVGLNETSK